MLAALLLAALALQSLAAGDIDLPEAGPIGGGSGRKPLVASIRPASGERAILARSMFAPPAAGGASAADPAGGVRIAGSIGIGRNRFAIVQWPDGRSAKVGIGGRVGDWRLRALRENGAALTRNDEEIMVPFGARGSLPATAAATRSQ